MRELLAELERVIDRGLPCVCCTVVATRGSTPQKAGANMLVYGDGTQAGTLGGGCVEAEVRRRALHALAAAGGPELHTFTLDDDFGWDDGLICGGRMTILADPVTAATAAYLLATTQRALVEHPPPAARGQLRPDCGKSSGGRPAAVICSTTKVNISPSSAPRP